MTYMLLLSIVFSAALIVLLWRGDPKRRRLTGQREQADSSRKRRMLSALALVPGAILAGLGDASAFLVWFGACAIAGWLVTQVQVRAG